jgi:hypothetical protein
VSNLLPGFQFGLSGEEGGFGRRRENPAMTAIILTVNRRATAWSDWQALDFGEKIEIWVQNGRISVECECTFERFIEMVKESGKVLDMRFCQTERIWENGDR